jgi:hypothetical protein
MNGREVTNGFSRPRSGVTDCAVSRSELDKLRIVWRELRGLPAAYQRLPVSWPAHGPCLRAQDAATLRRSELGDSSGSERATVARQPVGHTLARSGYSWAYCAQTCR